MIAERESTGIRPPLIILFYFHFMPGLGMCAYGLGTIFYALIMIIQGYQSFLVNL